MGDGNIDVMTRSGSAGIDNLTHAEGEKELRKLVRKLLGTCRQSAAQRRTGAVGNCSWQGMASQACRISAPGASGRVAVSSGSQRDPFESFIGRSHSTIMRFIHRSLASRPDLDCLRGRSGHSC